MTPFWVHWGHTPFRVNWGRTRCMAIIDPEWRMAPMDPEWGHFDPSFFLRRNMFKHYCMKVFFCSPFNVRYWVQEQMYMKSSMI